MTVRQVAGMLGLLFVVVLAVIVGKQMSAEAMAVVIGVVCGVAASIPTSVLLLVAFSRRDRSRQEAKRQASQPSYPPVVVIQGGTPQALPPALQSGYWPSAPPGPSVNRQFHLVGGDDLLLDEGNY